MVAPLQLSRAFPWRGSLFCAKIVFAKRTVVVLVPLRPAPLGCAGAARGEAAMVRSDVFPTIVSLSRSIVTGWVVLMGDAAAMPPPSPLASLFAIVVLLMSSLVLTAGPCGAAEGVGVP